MRSGIPTRGTDGTIFRSRLEARWAALFDAIGWKWEYEPFDLDGYIPDFAILGDRPLLVEVKPGLTLEELSVHAEKAEIANRDILIVGATPVLPTDYIQVSAAGIMIQWDTFEQERHALEDIGFWHHCSHEDCRQIAVHHASGGFWSYPCGHYEGDHYLGILDPEELSTRWVLGRNATQWASR